MFLSISGVGFRRGVSLYVVPLSCQENIDQMNCFAVEVQSEV